MGNLVKGEKEAKSVKIRAQIKCCWSGELGRTKPVWCWKGTMYGRDPCQFIMPLCCDARAERRFRRTLLRRKPSAPSPLSFCNPTSSIDSSNACPKSTDSFPLWSSTIEVLGVG
jgi:hypothetical protein